MTLPIHKQVWDVVVQVSIWSVAVLTSNSVASIGWKEMAEISQRDFVESVNNRICELVYNTLISIGKELGRNVRAFEFRSWRTVPPLFCSSSHLFFRRGRKALSSHVNENLLIPAGFRAPSGRLLVYNNRENVCVTSYSIVSRCMHVRSDAILASPRRPKKLAWWSLPLMRMKGQ